MPVQFGVAIRNFVGPGETPDVGALIAYAQRAEELGFESLWAWDHVLLGVDPSFPVLDSLTILTALAVRTTRIRLGTGVMVLPLRNPVVTAKVLASLDQTITAIDPKRFHPRSDFRRPSFVGCGVGLVCARV